MYREFSAERLDKSYFHYLRFQHEYKKNKLADYRSFYMSRVFSFSKSNPLKRFFFRSMDQRFALERFTGGLRHPPSFNHFPVYAHVEFNRDKCYYISIDLDIEIENPYNFLGMISHFIQPTIVVYNRKTQHCHLIYEIDKPYSLKRKYSYRTRLAKAFRKCLNDAFGGDPKYHGFFVRNPFNLFRHITFYCKKVYTWDEIDEFVKRYENPGLRIIDQLEEKLPSRPFTEVDAPVFYPRLNHAVPEGMRNVTLFDYGRKFAYGVARVAKSENWLYERVKSYLTHLNEVFCKPPLPPSEIAAIAKSISGWVWERLNYFLTVKYRKIVPMDPHELRAKQRNSALRTTRIKLMKAKTEMYKRFTKFYCQLPFSDHFKTGMRLIKFSRLFLKGGKVKKYKSREKNRERRKILDEVKSIFGIESNAKLYRYRRYIEKLIRRFLLDHRHLSFLETSDDCRLSSISDKRLLLSDIDYSPIDKFKSRYWMSRVSLRIPGISSIDTDLEFWDSNISYLS